MSEDIRREQTVTAGSEEKDFPFEKLFIGISVIFLLITGAFYGYRAYRSGARKAPSGQSLAAVILKNNQITENGQGLYDYDGIRIFRGKCENNYVKYNGLLWRIMQVNGDNTVRLISARAVNQLPFGNVDGDFSASQLNEYLNGHFLSLLDQSTLVDTSYYAGQISDLNAPISQPISSKVALCDVASFLNSVVNGTTYLADEPGSFWLTGSCPTGIYRAVDGRLTSSPQQRLYQVRPVITVNAEVEVISGSGTLTDPYMCDETGIRLGTTIRLGSDEWLVCQIDEDAYRLVRKEALEELRSFGLKGDSFDPEKEETLAHYLNNEYASSLPYSNLLVNREWSCGDFSGRISDLSADRVSCKVALASLADIKLSEASGYWLLTTSEKYAFTYGQQAELFKPTVLKRVVPVIAISRDTKLTRNADGSYKAGE